VLKYFMLGLLLGLFPVAATAEKGIGIYSEVKSVTYSEPMNIDGFIDHFSGTLSKGNKALTHNSAEIGFVWNNWRVARITRYDYQLQFTPDTAYLNYQIENNLPIDESRSYNLYLNAEHLRSSGIKLGYMFSPRSDLQLNIAGSMLKSSQFYSGHIRANIHQGSYSSDSLDELNQLIDEINSLEDPDYTDVEPYANRLTTASNNLRSVLNGSEGRLEADYHYYKPGLHEDEIEAFNNVDFSAPSGSGVAFDVSARWQFNEKLAFTAEIQDVFSYIRWKKAPYSRGEINAKKAGLSALDIFDRFIEQDVVARSRGEFFTSINPSDPDDPAAALPDIKQSLQEDHADFSVSNSDFVQHLPYRATVGAYYELFDWLAAGGSVFTTEAATFSAAEVELWKHLGVSYNLQTEALGLDFHSKYFRLAVASDKSQYEDAKFLSFIIGFNLVF